MIYIKYLKPDERATWGICPVCLAKAGAYCIHMPGDSLLETTDQNQLGYFTHAARLYNAPQSQAVENYEAPGV